VIRSSHGVSRNPSLSARGPRAPLAHILGKHVVRMTRACLSASITIALVSCSSHHPSKPQDSDLLVSSKFDVDQWPTWSHDGRTIAFHRVLASTDGPAGVYVISATGGKPRLVVQSGLFWPRQLAFSPDDAKLVCDWGQLSIIDVATGNVTVPLYTDNRVSSPSWSPDGTRIAYARILRDWNEPEDSVGTHLYSLVTGQDEVLRRDHQVLNGNWPQWSADGGLFAYIGNHPSGKTAVYVMTPDSVHHVAAVATGWEFERFQWFRWASGDDRLLITERTFSGRYEALVVKSNGEVVGPWPLAMNRLDAASTDGRWAVLVRGQPRDSMGVLFVQDAEGRTIPRQITSWEPTTPSTSVSDAIWAEGRRRR
jgi:dipeptidyl aminopeptidase/acylaminoacyl peptidase